MDDVAQEAERWGSHRLTVIENLMIPPMDLLERSRQEAYDRGMELLRGGGVADKASAPRGCFHITGGFFGGAGRRGRAAYFDSILVTRYNQDLDKVLLTHCNRG